MHVFISNMVINIIRLYFFQCTWM